MKSRDDSSSDIELSFQDESSSEESLCPNKNERRPINYYEDESSEEDFFIKKEHLKINYDQTLGSGGFGTVYVGVINNQTVAVKQASQACSRNEINIMTYLSQPKNRHANILPLNGYYYSEGYDVLVTPLASNGSLDKHIPNLSTEKQWNFTLDIVQAVVHLAKHKIAHFDIKPKNILIDDNWNPKLGDFGGACKLDESKPRCIRTLGFAAPEMFSTKTVPTIAADCYSLGSTIFCMWAKVKNPYTDKSQPKLTNEEKQDKTIKGILPVIPSNFPKEISHAISRLWSLQPEKRPSSAIIEEELKAAVSPNNLRSH